MELSPEAIYAERRSWPGHRCLIGPTADLTRLREDECVEAITPHGWLVRRRPAVVLSTRDGTEGSLPGVIGDDPEPSPHQAGITFTTGAPAVLVNPAAGPDILLHQGERVRVTGDLVTTDVMGTIAPLGALRLSTIEWIAPRHEGTRAAAALGALWAHRQAPPASLEASGRWRGCVFCGTFTGTGVSSLPRCDGHRLTPNRHYLEPQGAWPSWRRGVWA